MVLLYLFLDSIGAFDVLRAILLLILPCHNSMKVNSSSLRRISMQQRMIRLVVFAITVTPKFTMAAVHRELSGVSSDAVLEMEFYHDIDDTTISVGQNHACVLSMVEDSDIGGEVVCWGENFDGQAEPPPVSLSWWSPAFRLSVSSFLLPTFKCGPLNQRT
jgi:hypothetical protein